MPLRTVTLRLRQHLTPVLQRLSSTEQIDQDLALFVAVRTCLARLYAYHPAPDVAVEMSVELADKLLAALEGEVAPDEDLDPIRDALALEGAAHHERQRTQRPARPTVRGSRRLFGADEEDSLG